MDLHSKLLADASSHARDAHLARSNVRVSGDTTHDYDDTALEVQRQRASGQMAAEVKRDKGAARGAFVMPSCLHCASFTTTASESFHSHVHF